MYMYMYIFVMGGAEGGVLVLKELEKSIANENVALRVNGKLIGESGVLSLHAGKFHSVCLCGSFSSN